MKYTIELNQSNINDSDKNPFGYVSVCARKLHDYIHHSLSAR